MTSPPTHEILDCLLFCLFLALILNLKNMLGDGVVAVVQVGEIVQVFGGIRCTRMLAVIDEFRVDLLTRSHLYFFPFR